MMTELERAKQTVLYAKVVGAGVQSLLSISMAENVKLLGGDAETALTAVVAQLQQHVAGFTVKSKDAGVTDADNATLQAEVHRRIGLMLFGAEEQARSVLGLQPHSQQSGH